MDDDFNLDDNEMFERFKLSAMAKYKCDEERAALYASYRMDGYAAFNSAVMCGLRDPAGA